MREKICFDFGWLFHDGDVDIAMPQVKGPIYTSAKTERKKQGPACIYYNDAVDDFRTDVEYNADRWVNVDLPHDYIINSPMGEKNNSALGYFDYHNAWYRKHFSVDESDRDRRITLYFEGVATRCDVYLNGCEIYHNLCGYVPFEVDISDYVKFGADNVLAVYTYFDDNEGWWYQGGGIYRHVWLCKTDPLCVDLYGVYAAPVRMGDEWALEIETTVRNDRYSPAKGKIISEIVAENGDVIGCAETEFSVNSREKTVVHYTAAAKNPKLWDVDSPNLYKVKTFVIENGETVDEYIISTGFRTIEFDPEKGLMLNGKSIKINGMCAHGDFGLTGKAVPDNIHRYKARQIKQMGANGYRCAHYPHAEAAMDACDREGLLVMAETRWFDSSVPGKHDLEMLIRRDRNHPSIFTWSLGNEEPHHLTDVGRRINKNLYHFAKTLDKYRPISAAVSNDPLRATVYDEADIVGVNYNHWCWEKVHAMHPDKPMFISECCATGTTRGWYFDHFEKGGRLSAYDMDANSWWTSREKFMNLYNDCPFLFGFFQWIAFEHRGETVWPRVCSVSGAVDLFMQKKDAFYQNLSYFTDEPMVHLLPHWNFEGLEGEPIKVYAYTNQPRAELFVNGESCGVCELTRYSHAEWTVNYAPGEIKCVVYDKDGRKVAEESRVTSGRAHSLKLALENGDDISANGEDIALITCTCVDENGVEVPTAAPYIHFTSEGGGVIIGTGSDNTDTSPVSLCDRQMYMGRALCGVKMPREHGKTRVYAQADNLRSTVITIEV